MNKEKRKLNIAMICDPIGDSKAGVILSTLRFAKLLTERGHKIIFIGAKLKDYKKHHFYDGIKTYRFRSLPIPKSGGWYLAFPTVKELKKIFEEEKIHVVHIILPMSGSIMAIKAARDLDIKVVAHSHSQPENLFMDMPKFIQPTLYKLWNSYLVWTYNRAEMLIYPSKLAHSLLEKLNKKDRASIIISNGININHFKPLEIGDFHERFNLPKDKIKLLYVGRLFPEKSIHTIIESLPHVLKKHSSTHLMIVGVGHLKDKLEKLAEKLKVRQQVTFLGLVSEEDKILAYNTSDIFILLSLAELEGMVVLEAMACGKPVIISDAEMSASRFLVEDNGFLFETKNEKHLAEQIIKLIKDKELREKMGEISLEKSKNYDIHKSVDKLEEVYYLALALPVGFKSKKK